MREDGVAILPARPKIQRHGDHPVRVDTAGGGVDGRRAHGDLDAAGSPVADAQDLTQETFIKALQRQDQLKDELKAAHWLSRIATNTALDFLRRHSRVTLCELDTAPEISGDTPEQIVLRSEHHEYLADGLRLLSPRERTALLLRDVEGLPAEEVAKRLDCSKATVRSHIANGRTKFRRYMERRKR